MWCGHVSAIGEASKHVHASQHGSFCHDKRNGLLSQPKAVTAARLHGRGVETFPGVQRRAFPTGAHPCAPQSRQRLNIQSCRDGPLVCPVVSQHSWCIETQGHSCRGVSRQ